jgi:hypothetical protein
MSITKHDLMYNPHLVQPLGSHKGALNKPTPVKIDIYELFLSNENVTVLCNNLHQVYQQNGGQSTRDKFRKLVLLLQHKFIKSADLYQYDLADRDVLGRYSYVEILRAINEDFSKMVYNYFKWNVYNPFHDLVDVGNGSSVCRRLKKGDELQPEDYGTLDLWRNQITQVSNKNFRDNNKIPVYRAGLHTRNYDRSNEGLKYDTDLSSMENQIHGYDMKEIRKSVCNYKSDEWFGFS